MTDKKESNKTKYILIALLFLSVITTMGIWYYQDANLKDMDELLRIANEEHFVLAGNLSNWVAEYEEIMVKYVISLDDYQKLDTVYIDLETSIPEIAEESFFSGYEDGNESGYTMGYEAGSDYGYSSGREVGKSIGYKNGRSDGYYDGYPVGYNEGYDFGHLDGAEAYAMGDYNGIYWFIRDPTYQEVVDFIRKDRTDGKEYSSTFVCHDYAFLVKNNAYELGLRCFWVYIEFGPLLVEIGKEREITGAHALIGFNTIDEGMVYIEPQTDDFVILHEGIDYWKDAVQSSVQYVPSFDVIVRWDVFW